MARCKIASRGQSLFRRLCKKEIEFGKFYCGIKTKKSIEILKILALLLCDGKNPAGQRHIIQVWQKPTTGSVFGVADIVADLRAFSGQFAAARHGVHPSIQTGAKRARAMQ